MVLRSTCEKTHKSTFAPTTNQIKMSPRTGIKKLKASNLKYRTEIDGLRAIAVLPVIFFHAGFELFCGGYVGVDVFFVISGYLITSIIIHEMEGNNFSLIKFYERRAKRILPALFFIMFLTLPFAYAWMLPSQLTDFAQSLIAVTFFSSNFLFWQESGYFAADAELKPLLHTWSLAIEEQYYLVFPIFMLGMWRYGKQKLLFTIVAITLVSLLLAEWGSRNRPVANFYLAPTRFWEMLVGSICAILTTQKGLKSSNPLSIMGLAMVFYAMLFFDESTPFPSIYTAIPVVGAALLIAFSTPDTWVGRLLSMRFFVGIGLISYSAYLWHQPLFAFARIRAITEPSQELMATLVVICLLLAWATWHWIEQPFRKKSSNALKGQRRTLNSSALAGAFFVAVGLAGSLGQGLEWRLSDRERLIASFSSYPYADFYRSGSCFLMPEQDQLSFINECFGSHTSAIFGDSHAAALSSYLSAHSDFSQFTSSGCPPVLGYSENTPQNCEAVNQEVIEILLNLQPKSVLLHANWIGHWRNPEFQLALMNTIEILIENGMQVVVIGGVPQFSPNILALARHRSLPLNEGSRLHVDLTELLEINSEIDDLATPLGAIFWDPISELCDANSNCIAVVRAHELDMSINGVSLVSWDYGHLTLSGAAVVGSSLLDFLHRQ